TLSQRLLTSLLHPALLFFFTPTPPTQIYTLSLHDALPIWRRRPSRGTRTGPGRWRRSGCGRRPPAAGPGPGSGRTHLSGARSSRSEEHTSELQSRENLVCRLLLEKKKNIPG